MLQRMLTLTLNVPPRLVAKIDTMARKATETRQQQDTCESDKTLVIVATVTILWDAERGLLAHVDAQNPEFHDLATTFYRYFSELCAEAQGKERKKAVNCPRSRIKSPRDGHTPPPRAGAPIRPC